MVPESLVLALDFHRAPLSFRHLSDPAQPLPEAFETLVGELVSTLSPRQIEASAVALRCSPSEIEEAARFFVRQVLLPPRADYYRILGLSRQATGPTIRHHYHGLVRMFHPDLSNGKGDLDVAYTVRINKAYNTLRDPKARRRYDERLPNPQSTGHRQPSPGNLFRPARPIADRVAVPSDAPIAPNRLHRMAIWALIGTGAVAAAIALLRTESQPVLRSNPENSTRLATGPSYISGLKAPAGTAPAAQHTGLADREGWAHKQSSIKPRPQGEPTIAPQAGSSRSSAKQRTHESHVASESEQSTKRSRPQGKSTTAPHADGAPFLADHPTFELLVGRTEEQRPTYQRSQAETAVARSTRSIASISEDLTQELRGDWSDSRRTSQLLVSDATPPPADLLRPVRAATPPPTVSPDPPKAPAKEAPRSEASPTPAPKKEVSPPAPHKVAAPRADSRPTLPAKREANAKQTKPAAPTTPSTKTDPRSTAVPPAKHDAVRRVAIADNLVRRLAAAYRRGDLQTFLSFFASNARVNEGRGIAFIRTDYASFFASTSERYLHIQKIRWKSSDNGSLVGTAFVRAYVRDRGASRSRRLTGTLELLLVPRGKSFRINKLIHRLSQR